MDTNKMAEEAVGALDSAIDKDFSEVEKARVKEIVHDLLVQAIGGTTESHASTVVQCCGPEADMAHKLQHEMMKAQDALIANLSAMR